MDHIAEISDLQIKVENLDVLLATTKIRGNSAREASTWLQQENEVVNPQLPRKRTQETGRLNRQFPYRADPGTRQAGKRRARQKAENSRVPEGFRDACNSTGRQKNGTSRHSNCQQTCILNLKIKTQARCQSEIRTEVYKRSMKAVRSMF